MTDTNSAGEPEWEGRIFVGVDVAVFTIRDDALHLLLAPAGVAWRLPGDRIRTDESLDLGARRALNRVARASTVWLEQLFTFGDIDRDRDGRVITVAHYALVSADAIEDDAALPARWWPVAALPTLVLDHRRIIDYALARLRNKLEYTTVGFQLLPQRFTLSELQRVYEVILGRDIDKRNFRRKVEGLGIVKPTREQRIAGSGRPAQLYRFVATAAPEAIGAPAPAATIQPTVQLARIGPVVRRRGRVVPVTPAERTRA
jgi:8-oxo-dGTP diphosphatase